MLNKWTYLFHLYFVLKLLYYVYIYKKGENSDLCKPVLLDIRQTNLCNLFDTLRLADWLEKMWQEVMKKLIVMPRLDIKQHWVDSFTSMIPALGLCHAKCVLLLWLKKMRYVD